MSMPREFGFAQANMDSTSQLSTELPKSRKITTNVISLRTLFQVVTACAMFFALLRTSPTLALIAVVVFAPAIIRTAWIADWHRQQHEPFCWRTRLRYFAGSLGVVLTIAACGLLAFALVSLSFGLLGLLFGLAVASSDFCFDAAIIGTVGGMIWGMAGGVLASCFAICKLWKPSFF